MEPEPRRGFLQRLKQALGGNSANTEEDLEREIHGLVDQGEAQGFITQREGQMIEAILDLDETTAGQIMVPRIEMATVDATASLEATVQVIVESGHSRIPITGEDLDHIIGVIHAKDLLPHWQEGEADPPLTAICRQPFFVPQSKPVDQLLSDFKRKRAHLAIVVDEYGGTAGIVTIEDVLEEIVGEIVDEYDQEEPQIRQQADGSLLVDARLETEKLAEHLNIELPEELPEGRFETVGGFITTLLGRVPRTQEEVSYGSLRMVVTGADERRITQVQVHHGSQPAAPSQGD
ncbi:MAG: hemolysin family protein [Desulfarculaceae bacterium]|nr:hemolysin family protein [Desulfarculaceae bacterium]MCF8071848.1 hemolysin family protein [Desulfarculaceae bacterium]MCF8101398.1 hemolysin family protein [Desulfarculaceae bacterium]MCF8117389.1 hemolysin family protein [Desulfarculaceae bacterium]